VLLSEQAMKAETAMAVSAKADPRSERLAKASRLKKPLKILLFMDGPSVVLAEELALVLWRPCESVGTFRQLRARALFHQLNIAGRRSPVCSRADIAAFASQLP
jgi:hypothetical protein